VEGSAHSTVVVDRDHARQTSVSILEMVEAVRSDQPLTQ
jgi:2-keto-3-deoxy-L-rhamnonate aldolase RhmA